MKAPFKIELDEEMKFLFLKLKNKLGENFSNKEFLRRMLKMMVENEKSLKQAKKTRKILGEKVTRYIPIQQRREAFAKTDGRCAFPNCIKPAEILHHRERFSIRKSHESIIPLCKEHHEFAHNGLIQNEVGEPKKWKTEICKDVIADAVKASAQGMQSGMDAVKASAQGVQSGMDAVKASAQGMQSGPDVLFCRYRREALS